MPKINLFTNYYKNTNKERQKELDFCFNTNKESGLFSEIINFKDRPTYNDFFFRTKLYPNDINVFANSDIYFNDTINHVFNIQDNQCYALTRWEISNDKIVPFEVMHSYNKEAKAKHSQDVWIFKGAVNGVNGWFHIGVPGCDNLIAWHIRKAGYELKNPSNIIQAIHKHKEQARAYTAKNIVDKNGRVMYPTGSVGAMSQYLWVEVEGQKEQQRTEQKKVRFRI